MLSLSLQTMGDITGSQFALLRLHYSTFCSIGKSLYIQSAVQIGDIMRRSGYVI